MSCLIVIYEVETELRLETYDLVITAEILTMYEILQHTSQKSHSKQDLFQETC